MSTAPQLSATSPKPHSSSPRLALVTGAGRGIGAAIAQELAQRGFALALLERPGEVPQAAATTTTTPAPTPTPAVHWFEADLAELDAEQGHAALVARIVHQCGPIHVLVNNAGVPARQRGDMLTLTPQAFDQVLGVNLRGTFFLTQAVARHMLACVEGEMDAHNSDSTQGTPTAPPARCIVTVSSVSAQLASVERAEYCLSKAALPMLNQLFALRLAAQGVGVFEVRPGIIRTPMTAGVAPQYEARIRDGLVPAQRWGEPHDVARAVAALSTGELNFATGSVLHVDGGLAIARL